jgi:hypothetical protein
VEVLSSVPPIQGSQSKEACGTYTNIVPTGTEPLRPLLQAARSTLPDRTHPYLSATLVTTNRTRHNRKSPYRPRRKRNVRHLLIFYPLVRHLLKHVVMIPIKDGPRLGGYDRVAAQGQLVILLLLT